MARTRGLCARALRGTVSSLSTCTRNSDSSYHFAASFAICGMTTNGLIGTHLIPAGVDHGMAAVTAVILLAVASLLAAHSLCKRFPKR